MKNEKLIYITAYVLLNALCLAQLFSVGKLCLLLTAAVVLLAVWFPYSEMGVYLFVTLPFFNVLNAKMGAVSMYYLLTGLAMFVYLWRGRDRKFAWKCAIFLAFLLITADGIGEPKKYAGWILCALPLIFLWDEPMLTRKLPKIIGLYSLSMLFSSAWGWLMLKSDRYIYASSGGYTRFAGLTGDSVFYGAQLIWLISMLALLSCKNTARRKSNLACIILFVFFGSMTYSKTFFFCLGTELILVYFYWMLHQKKDVRFLIRNAAAVAGAGLVLMLFLDQLFHGDISFFVNLRLRFQAGDLLTGRADIWRYYIGWMLAHPYSFLVGMPLSEYMGAAASMNYVHNIFLETVVLFGAVVSAVLFLRLSGWVVRVYLKRRDILYLSPVIMMLMTGMTLHGHLEYLYYMNLLLVLTCAKWLDGNRKEWEISRVGERHCAELQ